MSIESLQNQLNSLKTQYTKEKTTLDLYLKQKEQKEKELENTEREHENILIMKELLEKSSDEARLNGKEILSQTASSSLQMVMGDNLKVDMVLGHRSGVPIADLEIVNEYGGKEIRIDPNNEGGGIRDLVSLSTFMATGFLVAGDNKAPYFLDEPTKYVSEEYAEKTAHAIKKIVDYAEKQAIIVTHEKTHLPSVADVAYELVKDDTTGITKSVRKS